MTGKEVASLLKCIIEKKKLKWGRGRLFTSWDNSYCALGLVAKSCGVPDSELGRMPSWTNLNMPGLNHVDMVVASNDNSETFEHLCTALEGYSSDIGMEGYIESCKNYAKSLGVKEEDCEG